MAGKPKASGKRPLRKFEKTEMMEVLFEAGHSKEYIKGFLDGLVWGIQEPCRKCEKK